MACLAALSLPDCSLSPILRMQHIYNQSLARYFCILAMTTFTASHLCPKDTREDLITFLLYFPPVRVHLLSTSLGKHKNQVALLLRFPDQPKTTLGVPSLHRIPVIDINLFLFLYLDLQNSQKQKQRRLLVSPLFSAILQRHLINSKHCYDISIMTDITLRYLYSVDAKTTLRYFTILSHLSCPAGNNYSFAIHIPRHTSLHLYKSFFQ